MLLDSFNRNHDYLRISLTDKCNLRCTYCHPSLTHGEFFKSDTHMTAEEIETIVSVFVKEGVKKIRLTGGEPLIRKDAKDIIRRLSKFPVELVITTNAVFVHEFIETFQQSNIHSVNTSLDSLQKDRNIAITKRDEFDRVKQNIDLLLKNKFHVKVNVVVMKGVNHDEITDFVEWTRFEPIHVRFIEFMPFDGNEWSHEKVISHKEILDVISTRFEFHKLLNEKNDTSKKYFVPKHLGTFAIISTMSEPFCSTCNRMRLTTDGKMKNCLFSTDEVDILGALRKGDDILPLIRRCVQDKKESLGGQFTSDYNMLDAGKLSNRSMINIGG